MTEHSTSAGSTDIDSVEELAKLFTGGHVDLIVNGLLAARNILMRDDPETAYCFFADSLPEVWSAAKQPYSLLLQLIDQPALLRRPGDKIDLITLLIRALRKIANEEEDDDEEDDQDSSEQKQSTPSSVASTLPPGMTLELIERAKEFCMRGNYLAPRSFEALVKLYRVKLSEAELLGYAQSCFSAGNYRDCAEFLTKLKLESDAFPHALLLQHLISSDRQSMDVFASYLSISPTFLTKHVHHALTFLAEYPRPDFAYEERGEPRPGNDPNGASKLITKFGLRLQDFPRIVYLKMSDVIWWIVRINKAADFGLLLAGDDVALQRKLLRELMKSRNFPDHLCAAAFLDEWRESQLTDGGGERNKEHQAFYERTKTLWLTERETYLSSEELFMRELRKAIALAQEQPQNVDENARLLLPMLPPAIVPAGSPESVDAVAASSSPSSSSVPASPPSPAPFSSTLPQLFLRPEAILWVDSIESVKEARKHLLAEDCKIVGIDLEHLPENLEGMNVRPTLCQLLQISCKTKVCLFDLQVLHLPVEGSAAPTASIGVSSSSATSSASAVSSVTERFFPSIPSQASHPTPTTPELVAAMSDLLLTIFLDSDLLKVGIGFSQDLRKLRGDFGDLMPFRVTLQNYVDLTSLLKILPDPDQRERDQAKRAAALVSKTKSAARKASLKASKREGNNTATTSTTVSASPSPPLPSDSRQGGGGYTHAAKKEGGLLKLVRIVLRRHLDKTEQISNWSKRPLTMPQAQYAALDAYSCILVYEAVQRRGIELEAENIEATSVG